MNDLVTSLIRTYVPVIIGSVLAWLTARGLDLDEATSTAVVTGLTGLVIAVYYTAVRLLERSYPKVGVLLGSTKKPAYVETK